MAAGYFGIYRGVVANAADPEQRGRLQLQVPTVTGFRPTNWAEASHTAGVPASPPKAGAPVWVQFEGGDTMRPIWVGIPGSTEQSGGPAGFSFDTLTVGALTVTTSLKFGATGDYFVDANKYVFRYTPAPNYGLLFNAAAGAYQFTNGSGTSIFSIDANGGTSTATGGFNADTAFIGRFYDGTAATFKNKNAADYSLLHSQDGSTFLNTGSNQLYFRKNNAPLGNWTAGGLRIGDDTPATGALDVRLTGTAGGWDRFIAKGTGLWGDGNTVQNENTGSLYVTIGAGGSAGIMVFNPHIVWNPSNNEAAIRYGRSGGIGSGSWWGQGVNSSGNWWLYKDGNQGSPRMTIDGSGNLSVAGALNDVSGRVYSPGNPQPVTPPSITGAMMLMGA